MQTVEEREEKQKINKTKAAIIGVVVVAIVAFAAFKSGVIPGFGDGGKAAAELKTEIEALQGKNLGIKYSKIIDQFMPTMLPPGQKEQLDAQVKKMSEGMEFSYASLDLSSKGSTGIVEINSAVVKNSIDTPDLKMGALEYDYPKITVSKTNAAPNHYKLEIPGNLDMYTTSNGEKTKVLTIAAESNVSEFTLENGLIRDLSGTSKNISLIEGRGNTVIAKIGDIAFNYYMHGTPATSDIGMKIAVHDVEPGDMIKMMLKGIKPLSLTLDYTYKGDNLGQALQKLTAYQQQQEDDETKAQGDPNYKPNANKAAPELKSFNGDLKLNDFSLLLGDAGLAINAKLMFKKENPKAIPFGEVNIKLAQYQQLLDFIHKFYNFPQQQADLAIKFLSDVGTNANGSILINIKMDGTDKVLIGGKTLDQVKAIAQKDVPQAASPFAPQLPSSGSGDGVQAVPPAPVKGKPIIEDGTKI